MDVNDIVAIDAHRQLVEVNAGVSIREAKRKDTKWQELAQRYVDDDQPQPVWDEFRKELSEAKFPGRNFGATLEDVTKSSEPDQKQPSDEEQAETFQRLQEESKENELKVTRTSTGQPKVDESGNTVVPIQSEKGDKDSKKGSATTATAKPAQPPVVVVKDSDKK